MNNLYIVEFQDGVVREERQSWVHHDYFTSKQAAVDFLNSRGLFEGTSKWQKDVYVMHGTTLYAYLLELSPAK